MINARSCHREEEPSTIETNFNQSVTVVAMPDKIAERSGKIRAGNCSNLTEIKTMMKTWTKIAKTNCNNKAQTLKTAKKAVQSTVQGDARSKNFIIHGIPDDYS